MLREKPQLKLELKNPQLSYTELCAEVCAVCNLGKWVIQGSLLVAQLSCQECYLSITGCSPIMGCSPQIIINYVTVSLLCCVHIAYQVVSHPPDGTIFNLVGNIFSRSLQCLQFIVPQCYHTCLTATAVNKAIFIFEIMYFIQMYYRKSAAMFPACFTTNLEH